MENKLEIFENESFGKVRVHILNGEPMFCLSDICKSIGLQNPSSVKSRLDKEDVQLIDLHALKQYEGSIIGNSKANFVNESGFYDVLLQSDSPKVKPFRKWVTSVVLPSIRKNGGYISNQEQMTPEQIVANALIVAQNIIENQKKELEAAKPKVEYFDNLVDRKLNINFRDTAKEIKIGPKAFIQWLLDKGFVYRDKKNQLKPYSEHVEDGLFEIKEYSNKSHSGNQTLITPKGRETFRLLIK